MSAEPITRDDLRDSFAGLQDEVEETAESGKNVAIAAGIGILAVLLILAWLLGRRRGKQDKTIVEIRRV